MSHNVRNQESNEIKNTKIQICYRCLLYLVSVFSVNTLQPYFSREVGHLGTDLTGDAINVDTTTTNAESERHRHNPEQT